jgi:4-diphosphocytidyl-2-C-methyl-D-erythritol kinase
MPRPSLHRPVIERAAHAKVNLALSVGPAREDGYHPIASWMARVDLVDDLELTRLEDDYLSRYAILWHDDAVHKTPIDWSITKDLAVRAHLLLEKEAGRTLPVQLKLQKRIPVGGGLGGGSSDAAAMLLAVRELFALDVADERLVELAMELGSDVAYFLHDGPAVVEGFGERVEHAPDVEGHLALAIPEFGCPTGAVYRAFDAKPTRGVEADRVRGLAGAGEVVCGELFNRLEDPALAVEPRLGAFMDAVEKATGGRRAHVSGSGSTVFVVCDGRRDAARTAAAIEAQVDGAAGVIPVEIVAR